MDRVDGCRLDLTTAKVGPGLQPDLAMVATIHDRTLELTVKQTDLLMRLM